NDNNYFKYKRDLKKFFKEHQEFSIVWGHMDGLASIYFKVAKKCGIKSTIAHAHITSSEKSLKGFIKRLLKKNISKYADYRFACSTEAGNYLYGKNDFELVPNAIDTSKFRFNAEMRNNIRKKYSWEDKIVLGHVGRFNDQKNHRFLIRIFKCLSEYKNNYVLCLCGDGENRNSIEQQVINLNLNDRVFFMGNISNVNELYQAFDLFLMPSLYEGLPVSGIEAQSCGLNCVFSDTITREVSLVQDKVKFLSLKNSPDYWAQIINSFIDYERFDMAETVRKAGYDINYESVKLQNFFNKIKQ
ncbi:MAG: glycosyltransferase, partial [Lachnospiraceae bacterium]|nr:glycosyltransferase [Lachnospiraceae bacterium]